MSTIKAKNIKQTVIGGTTQPLKIGGILEDGSDAKISIDTSGNLTASNLTATFSGLLTTNGQIKFPATQNPSADANTLDDYEEGTFIPYIYGSTSAGTGTYNAQVGRYTKIGNVIAFTILLNWTAHTGTGYFRVGNLPFISNNIFVTFPVWNGGITIGASNVLDAYLNTNSYEISLNRYADAVNNDVSIDTSGALMISGTYFTV